MEMIRARNLTSHTYNTNIAAEIVNKILGRFYPAFNEMEQRFARLRDQVEQQL